MADVNGMIPYGLKNGSTTASNPSLKGSEKCRTT